MDSLTLVIFGITSNLSQIKLLPALYDMAEKGLLPQNMTIIGNARKPVNKSDLRKYVDEVLHAHNRHHKHSIKSKFFENLIEKMSYIEGHLDDPTFYQRLKETLSKVQKNKNHNTIYYLATYPDLYHHVFENLNKFDMNQQSKEGWVRLMIEKPIGNDLESAKKLNSLLLKYFTEDQIFRLDHYLGKETLQNILTFRFGNGIFESLMNKDHIDHIQITASEDFGIGRRGGYYDGVGSLKDVGQNHQLQMLAFATMDAPKEFTNEAVTKERLKILQSLKPLSDSVVFGQYEGYTKEENVKKSSDTDTFYAFKTYIENERFKNVPIYVRGGKMMTQTLTEIVIVFKKPNNRLFKNLNFGEEPNALIYRIQPDEGILLKILMKKPGHTVELEPSFMQFTYNQDSDFHALPDPYERLISDAMRGDQTFFNDASEVEAQWAFVDPLLDKHPKPFIYKKGSWGPKEADDLIEKDSRKWLVTTPNS